MLFSTDIVDFNVFYDGSVGLQIRALLTRSPFGVSQVTVMACELVVHILINIYFDSTMITDPTKKPRV